MLEFLLSSIDIQDEKACIQYTEFVFFNFFFLIYVFTFSPLQTSLVCSRPWKAWAIPL